MSASVPHLSHLLQCDFDDLDETTSDATPYPGLAEPMLSRVAPANDSAPSDERAPTELAVPLDTPSDPSAASTTLPEARAPRSSYVRIHGDDQSMGEAERLVEALGDEQLSLMVDIVCLEHDLDELEEAAPERSALGALRRSVSDLVDVRAALSDVVDDTALPTVLPLMTLRSPLAVYLKGLFVACDRIVVTLSDVACKLLNSPNIDWHETRARLGEAEVTVFDGLTAEIRGDLAALAFAEPSTQRALERFAAKVDQLLWAVWYMRERLAHRFSLRRV
jgi:hypothetical protein